MPWHTHCILGDCNLPALCREAPGHGCIFCQTCTTLWLLLCRVMMGRGVQGTAGPGLGFAWWYLHPETVDSSWDTDHRAAEGSRTA